MRKVLRKKEVCEKCKKVTFEEESITICDICNKEIPDHSEGWKYTLRMIKVEQPEDNNFGSDAWKFDLCSFECFLKCLKRYHHLEYEYIWGFHLEKEDVSKILELIKQ